jgi:chaperone modulatory protein CbpM
MTPVSHALVVIMKRRELLSLEALARRAGVHPALVQRYVELDLIHPSERRGADLFFAPDEVMRLNAVNRLRRSLGINLPGIGMVLDLVDQISALRRENDRLRRK